MVGNGHDAQAGRRHLVDEQLRGERAIRRGCVKVEVDLHLPTRGDYLCLVVVSVAFGLLFWRVAQTSICRSTRSTEVASPVESSTSISTELKFIRPVRTGFIRWR